jgi:hypothetical protein
VSPQVQELPDVAPPPAVPIQNLQSKIQNPEEPLIIEAPKRPNVVPVRQLRRLFSTLESAPPAAPPRASHG